MIPVGRRSPRITIVGGGISGLATAYFLTDPRRSARPRVTLVESDDRLGGKIQTLRLGGHPVDLGPDALLYRSPTLRGLLSELGLEGTVVAPSTSGAFILSRGRLRRLPAGTVFGVPTRLWPLLRSGLLSPAGFMRAGWDLVAPSRSLPEDPSVGELLLPRFGQQVFERMIEPLLGGVHAGRARQLSARGAIPEVEAAARRSRSVYMGLRASARGGGAGRGAARNGSGPVLVSLSGGLGSLVTALTERLSAPERGPVTTRLGAPANGLAVTASGEYEVTLDSGEVIASDAVVLATPAFATGTLLSQVAPDAAAALGEVEYAAVASVTLRYPSTRLPEGTGFLVPPEENRLLVGCTWLSSKWPHLADGPNAIIRCLVGRHGDPNPIPARDEELIRAVHAELADALPGSLPPLDEPPPASVRRWSAGLPQYTVGHPARVERVYAELGRHPGLRVTGAAYHGVGIANCVTRAERTAVSLLDALASEDPVDHGH